MDEGAAGFGACDVPTLPLMVEVGDAVSGPRVPPHEPATTPAPTPAMSVRRGISLFMNTSNRPLDQRDRMRACVPFIKRF
jgi:hypothetical protein